MPFQFRPFPQLPWIPIINARTLQLGEEVTVAHELHEGTCVWTVAVQSENEATTECTLPYTYHAHHLDLEPVTGKNTAIGKDIEKFGPGTRIRENHFRYVAARRR